MGWSLKKIEKLQREGKIKGFKAPVKKKPAKKKHKTVQPEPKALQEIKKVLQNAGISCQTEYRFHPVRKFRFDIAIPEKMLAIEYEGIFSARSRHTSLTGYTRDADKYNLAQGMGWRVLRYTALNYKNFESDLKTLFL